MLNDKTPTPRVDLVHVHEASVDLLTALAKAHKAWIHQRMADNPGQDGFLELVATHIAGRVFVRCFERQYLEQVTDLDSRESVDQLVADITPTLVQVSPDPEAKA